MSDANITKLLYPHHKRTSGQDNQNPAIGLPEQRIAKRGNLAVRYCPLV